MALASAPAGVSANKIFLRNRNGLDHIGHAQTVYSSSAAAHHRNNSISPHCLSTGALLLLITQIMEEVASRQIDRHFTFLFALMSRNINLRLFYVCSCGWSAHRRSLSARKPTCAARSAYSCSIILPCMTVSTATDWNDPCRVGFSPTE